MSKRIDMTCVTLALFIALSLINAAQAQSKRFSKLKPIEAYEVRPGVLMMPRYAEDGEVCEIGLERIRYSSGSINRNSSLSREEIEQIVDELVPASERGPKPRGLLGHDTILQIGNSYTIVESYEDVTVQIYSDASRKCNIGNVAARIVWDKRQCSPLSAPVPLAASKLR